MTDKQSIFTTLPEIKNRTVAENETAWAFLTNIPITPGDDGITEYEPRKFLYRPGREDSPKAELAQVAAALRNNIKG